MQTLLAFLFLCFSSVIFAEERYPGFIFPPFAKEDIKNPAHSLSDNFTHEELEAISVEEWRGMMTTGNSSIQDLAARQLLARGDQKTILRLVYSMKQGNVFAIETLKASTLAVIPYLMEDVANGSIKYYDCYSFGDAVTSQGNIRQASIARVTSALSNTSEFAEETKNCLREIDSRGEHLVQTQSDISRYLIEWWHLNKKAIEAGKWNETKPLPYEISYIDPKNDTYFPRDELSNESKQPPYGSPLWEIPESFEAWSARIVDPKQRNLDFVALSWDGKKVIEHPPVSLDPKFTLQERESRKTPAPRNPSEPESEVGRKQSSWFIVVAVLMVVLSIVRWMKRKPAGGI